MLIITKVIAMLAKKLLYLFSLTTLMIITKTTTIKITITKTTTKTAFEIPDSAFPGLDWFGAQGGGLDRTSEAPKLISASKENKTKQNL